MRVDCTKKFWVFFAEFVKVFIVDFGDFTVGSGPHPGASGGFFKQPQIAYKVAGVVVCERQFSIFFAVFENHCNGTFNDIIENVGNIDNIDDGPFSGIVSTMTMG